MRHRHAAAGPHLLCATCDGAIPLRDTLRRADGARLVSCPSCDAVYTWRVGSLESINPADRAQLQ